MKVAKIMYLQAVKLYDKALGKRSPYAAHLRGKGHGIESPKKGKGSYVRHPKHKSIDILT
tara:strand:- start:2547 stop:2726 length:180 start_codon:yes stop_codon:yes gene_type:complete